MDQVRASGAPVSVFIGGRWRTFRRLSRKDFGAIIERMPIDADRRLFMTAYDANRWAPTPEGFPVVLGIASLPVGYGPGELDARIAELAAEDSGWGSKNQKAAAASLICGESLLSGEEDTTANDEGKKRPDPPLTNATTPKRPGALRRWLLGWVTRGT